MTPSLHYIISCISPVWDEEAKLSFYVSFPRKRCSQFALSIKPSAHMTTIIILFEKIFGRLRPLWELPFFCMESLSSINSLWCSWLVPRMYLGVLLYTSCLHGLRLLHSYQLNFPLPKMVPTSSGVKWKEGNDRIWGSWAVAGTSQNSIFITLGLCTASVDFSGLTFSWFLCEKNNCPILDRRLLVYTCTLVYAFFL